MRSIIVLCVCILTANSAMISSNNDPVAMNSSPPATTRTLAQDLDEIARLIPSDTLRLSATRYPLYDEPFQMVEALINANDANTIEMHLQSQPEVVAFSHWLRQQIMLSGEELHLHESEEYLSQLSRLPFRSSSVYVWLGIVNEFLVYYPEDTIHGRVQAKIAQNGILAQLFQRLQALKPVYDSITALPAAQRLVAALEAKGINTTAIDAFVRHQFGWQQNQAAVVVTDDNFQTSDEPALPPSSGP